jgi:hypothetical protein
MQAKTMFVNATGHSSSDPRGARQECSVCFLRSTSVGELSYLDNPIWNALNSIHGPLEMVGQRNIA